ncbi:MAG: deoxyribonuclease IV [Candidatus Babeliales bacterium]
MNKKHTLLLGAHISTAGGFDKAITRAQSINCTAIQIFTKSNRQWAAKPITQDEQEVFKKAVKETGITSLLSHATYLINIGSGQEDILIKSRALLTTELERCDQLGIPYLVLHPGSYGTGSEQQCLETIATSLDNVFEHYTGSAMVLLENMAGQGSSVCYSFEQLAEIRTRTKYKNKVGICIDTCHAFAAGYDLRTSATYEQVWHEFDRIIGLSHLKALHINDSKKPLGSRVDRHAYIGQGAIGLEGFKLLFNDPRFFDIPKILETPCESDAPQELLRCYAYNMQVIKGLIENR